jgi:uncharacterized membrane protein YgdD (TMEM256/DUF423 family)
MKSQSGMSYWVPGGALLMALGVMAGAFGAHALRARISPEELAIYQTGVLYHLLHALALVVIGGILSSFQLSGTAQPALTGPRLSRAAWLLCFGLVVFSGSLYLMVFSGQRWLGMITPIGGLSMILGWLWLALAAVRFARATAR